MAWRSLEEALTLGYGTERSFICHVHDDTNASASVNSLTGLWICYACGARGKVDQDKLVIPITAVVKHTKRVQQIMEDPVHPYYPETWLDLFDAAGPGEYWLSRFSEETCRRFRLGIDPERNHATYPFRDSAGRIVGVVRRAIDVPGARYIYPFRSNASRALFNYHACTSDTIVIVEGAADAMAVVEAGAEAMATYGSNFSYHQHMLLQKYQPRRLLIGSDMDEAGEHHAKTIAEAFPFIETERIDWGAKDPAELPLAERTAVLARHGLSRVASEPCGSPEARPTASHRPWRPSSPPVRIVTRPRTA